MFHWGTKCYFIQFFDHEHAVANERFRRWPIFPPNYWPATFGDSRLKEKEDSTFPWFVPREIWKLSTSVSDFVSRSTIQPPSGASLTGEVESWEDLKMEHFKMNKNLHWDIKSNIFWGIFVPKCFFRLLSFSLLYRVPTLEMIKLN